MQRRNPKLQSVDISGRINSESLRVQPPTFAILHNCGDLSCDMDTDSADTLVMEICTVLNKSP
jgi:hypothetical protein